MFHFEAQVGETAIPLTVLVSENDIGIVAQSGLVSISKPGTSPIEYLDFDDDTFKASSWTTREEVLIEIDSIDAPGIYEFIWDSSASILDEDRVHIVYNISGPIISGISVDEIRFVDTINIDVVSIASGVWDRQTSLNNASGTFGELVNNIPSEHQQILNDLTAMSGALVIEINENETKLDSVLNNQTTILTNQTIISGLVDELEQGHVDICDKIVAASGAIPGDVWDIIASGHISSGTFGKLINDFEIDHAAISGFVDDLEDFTDTLEQGHIDICNKIIAASGAIPGDVWDIIASAHVASGTFGKLVNDLSDATDNDEVISTIIAASGGIVAEVNENEAKLDSVLNNQTTILTNQTTISGLVDELEQGHTDICDKIIAASGSNASDVWNFSTRTLTSVSGLEVMIDPSGLQDIANAVWDEIAADHVASGTFGKLINDFEIDHAAISGFVDDLEDFTDTLEQGHQDICDKIIAASGANASDVWNFSTRTLTSVSGLEVMIDASGLQDIANAVWDELGSSHTTSGTFGRIVQDIEGDINTLIVNQQLVSESRLIQIGEVAVPLNLLVTQGGSGVTGESAVVEIAIPGTSPVQFLDFDDDIFKTSGWTTKNQALIELDPSGLPGLYEFIWDSSSAVTSRIRLHAVYTSVGPQIPGITIDELNFVDTIITIGAIASGVWDETALDHTISGSFGEIVNNIPLDEVNVNVDEIASGVWNFTTRTLTGEFELGQGSVLVDHNFGGVDNLRVIGDQVGAPVDNVIITAFLKSDYDANNKTAAFIKAQTFTNVDGRWAAPMSLDPATYTLLFSKQGIVQDKIANITVT